MKRFLAILCLNFLLGSTALQQAAHANGTFDWSLSTDHGGGWKSSDWFGTYWESSKTKWIYHHKMGWLYRESASADSIWLWKDGVGWFWMTMDYPSYAYAHEWGGEEAAKSELGVYFDFIKAEAVSEQELPWGNPWSGWIVFLWSYPLRDSITGEILQDWIYGFLPSPWNQKPPPENSYLKLVWNDPVPSISQYDNGTDVASADTTEEKQPQGEENEDATTEEEINESDDKRTEVAALASEKFTHEIIDQEAFYYLTGPQQTSPPDGSFKKGTLLAWERDSGSYSLVRSESGITAYVSTEAIAIFEDIQRYAVKMVEAPDFNATKVADPPTLPLSPAPPGSEIE